MEQKILQQGETVHLRHDHVQKDQGEAPFLCGAEAFLRGVARGQLVIFPQNGAIFLFIIVSKIVIIVLIFAVYFYKFCN